MSDWIFSVKSTAASVNAGLDLEMPSARWRGQKLLEAVERGVVAEATIDTSVRRLLQQLVKAGLFEHAEAGPEQALDLPEHRALVREAAAEGSVLLKNEQHVLPLQREQLTSIAVIGPNAQMAQIMGGGSARVNAHYAITPFDGIVAKVGDHVSVRYEQGCTSYKFLPLLDADLLLAGKQGSEHGLTIEYFNSSDLTGAPVHRETQATSELTWFEQVIEGVNPQQFSVRATGRFTPQETGAYTFGLISNGRSRLSIDGREVLEHWTPPTPGGDFFLIGKEAQTTVTLEAGREYLLTLDFVKSEKVPLAAVRLGCLPPVPADAIERAARLAATSDVATVCVGFGDDRQSEGFDRPDMTLPGKQDALIEQVVAANPRTIVVLNTGSPITMPWLSSVAAVAEAGPASSFSFWLEKLVLHSRGQRIET